MQHSKEKQNTIEKVIEMKLNNNHMDYLKESWKAFYNEPEIYKVGISNIVIEFLKEKFPNDFK